VTLRTISWVAAPCSSTANAGGNTVDLPNTTFNGANGYNRLFGHALDSADLAGDLFGRPRRLARKLLHLSGDHGKAPSCFAGASGLKGGIHPSA